MNLKKEVPKVMGSFIREKNPKGQKKLRHDGLELD